MFMKHKITHVSFNVFLSIEHKSWFCKGYLKQNHVSYHWPPKALQNPIKLFYLVKERVLWSQNSLWLHWPLMQDLTLKTYSVNLILLRSSSKIISSAWRRYSLCPFLLTSVPYESLAHSCLIFCKSHGLCLDSVYVSFSLVPVTGKYTTPHLPTSVQSNNK